MTKSLEVYVAIDKDGREFIYNGKPKKCQDSWIPEGCCTSFIELPAGTIKKMLGKDLSWNNDPVQLKQ